MLADGKGKAPGKQEFEWLGNTFETNFSPYLPLPYMYPTPEGGIMAEWTINKIREISLDVSIIACVSIEVFNLNHSPNFHTEQFGICCSMSAINLGENA